MGLAGHSGTPMIKFKGVADASLECVTYTGNSKHFTFEAYVTLHQKGHAELDRLEEPVNENKKGSGRESLCTVVPGPGTPKLLHSSYMTQNADIVTTYSDQQ
jgi:hypothetical protein